MRVARLVVVLLCCALPWAVAAQPSGSAGPVAAERIAIAFERGSYAVVSRVPVTKVLPPSDDLPAGPGPFSGFWFELRGADGRLRYRRVIGDPVLIVAEAPLPVKDARPGSAAAPMERHAAVPDARTFTVLVPAPQAGDELLLFGPPYAPDAHGVMAAPAAPAASLEVARLALAVRP